MIFEYFLSPAAWIIAISIFILRLVSWALDNVRLLFIMNDRKVLVWLLGFLGVLAFLIAIGVVMADLKNPLNVLSFVTGSATGGVVGMMIEERLALGHIRLSIVSPTLGTAVADELRLDGFAVTEIPAHGRDGMVTMLRCDVLRKQIDRVETNILEVDPMAFVTASEVRPIRQGFWRIGR